MGDAFEDDTHTERVVSLNEYLQEVEAHELEADLVLGGDEGKECTYANGYMKRQAIFSCLTCVPDGNAGVCTACSLTCHDGHEMVELWTKRRFRCDCGNSKFGNFVCKLAADKDIENSENSYNQNFKGSYCTCSRPYPDPEASKQVEMIQCCICEDWFHEDHLGLSSVDEIPRDEEGEPLYEDFICQKCAPTFSFLKHYPSLIMSTPDIKGAAQATEPNPTTAGNGSVYTQATEPHPDTAGNGSVNTQATESHPNAAGNGSVNTQLTESHPNTAENGYLADSILSDDLKPDSNLKGKEPMNDAVAKCKLGEDINAISTGSVKTGTMFLSKKWREELCKCDSCISYYAKKGVEYLIDKEDTIEEYEKMAKEKRKEKLQQQEGAELNFMNNLNHVQKIEILNGISDMKNEFRSFLESSDPSKPITSDDVRNMFENLRKKKQRLF